MLPDAGLLVYADQDEGDRGVDRACPALSSGDTSSVERETGSASDRQAAATARNLAAGARGVENTLRGVSRDPAAPSSVRGEAAASAADLAAYARELDKE